MIKLRSRQYFGTSKATYVVGDLHITWSRYPNATVLPLHCHEQRYMFITIRGGGVEHCRGRDFTCARGTIVYNEAGEPHSDHFADPGVEGFNIELPLGWLERFRAEVPRRHDAVAYRHVGPEITALTSLELALATPDRLSRLGAEESIVRLLRGLSQDSIARGRNDRRLQIVAEHLFSNFASPGSLDEVAALVDLHPSHLCRLFAERYGCSMTEYTRRVRADAAATRVLNSKAELATIAFECGYSDQAHMTREFRRYLGITPGKIRARS